MPQAVVVGIALQAALTVLPLATGMLGPLARLSTVQGYLWTVYFYVAALAGALAAGYLARENGVLAGILTGVIPGILGFLAMWLLFARLGQALVPSVMSVGATMAGLARNAVLGGIGGYLGRWLWLRRVRRPSRPEEPEGSPEPG